MSNRIGKNTFSRWPSVHLTTSPTLSCARSTFKVHPCLRLAVLHKCCFICPESPKLRRNLRQFCKWVIATAQWPLWPLGGERAFFSPSLGKVDQSQDLTIWLKTEENRMTFPEPLYLIFHLALKTTQKGLISQWKLRGRIWERLHNQKVAMEITDHCASTSLLAHQLALPPKGPSPFFQDTSFQRTLFEGQSPAQENTWWPPYSSTFLLLFSHG